MKKISVLIMFGCFLTLASNAQHEHHGAEKDILKLGSMKMKHDMTEHSMNSISHALSLNLPMNCNGSGNGWLPDTSPMYGTMYHSKNWMYMLHGNLFLRYNQSPGLYQ